MIKTRMRLTVAFVALAASMFALVPAGPASAASATLAVQGIATLDSGTLACGTGSFEGTANGAHGNTPVVQARVFGNFTYCNDLVAGTAEGSLSITGMDTCQFEWVRTGTTASVTLECNGSGGFDDGTATAHLTVTSAPGQIPGTAHVSAQANIDADH